MSAIISYTDYRIPDNYLSVDRYVNLLEDDFLTKINMERDDLGNMLKNTINIEKIYVEDRKNEAGLFKGLLRKYFETGNTRPEDIDFLIYTRGNSLAVGDPWSMTDETCLNVPYYLQDAFEMKNAQVFNVEQVCAGTLVGARLAYSLIGDGSARKVLLLSANFFREPGNRLMGGLGLVSDGLGIMEIAAGDAGHGDTGLALVDFAGITDGSITMVKDFRNETNALKIVTRGADLIKKLLKQNDLTLDDISLLVPQNISSSGWNFYCQLLEFPRENVFLDTFSDGGHMADVDIIRNLTEVRRQELLEPGDYALVYALGTGTSWNVLLLEAL